MEANRGSISGEEPERQTDTVKGLDDLAVISLLLAESNVSDFSNPTDEGFGSVARTTKC